MLELRRTFKIILRNEDRTLAPSGHELSSLPLPLLSPSTRKMFQFTLLFLLGLLTLF